MKKTHPVAWMGLGKSKPEPIQTLAGAFLAPLSRRDKRDL